MKIPEYKLVRSRRKTVALHVDDSATLVVRAPRLLPKTFIDSIIHKRRRWILDAQKRREGEREHNILKEGRVYFRGMSIPTPVPTAQLEEWLKREAKTLIYRRVAELAMLHKYEFERVRVSGAKTRWGSCSSKNNINISWKLIMAPGHILDYVILHELAHLKHMNHSKAFWGQVEKSCDHYDDSRKWLKKHGRMLMLKHQIPNSK